MIMKKHNSNAKLDFLLKSGKGLEPLSTAMTMTLMPFSKTCYHHRELQSYNTK
jgi:hypothetical protein